MTVPSSRSWIDCKFKRRVGRLREGTGSAEAFVFDANIMRCGNDLVMRQLALFPLDATVEDPVGEEATVTLQVGNNHPRKSDGPGPIAADCYDVGQDLLAFVHLRKSLLVHTLSSSHSYATLQCV